MGRDKGKEKRRLTLLQKVTCRMARSNSVRLSMHVFGEGGGFGGDNERCTAYPVARRESTLTRGGITSVADMALSNAHIAFSGSTRKGGQATGLAVVRDQSLKVGAQVRVVVGSRVKHGRDEDGDVDWSRRRRNEETSVEVYMQRGKHGERSVLLGRKKWERVRGGSVEGRGRTGSGEGTKTRRKRVRYQIDIYERSTTTSLASPAHSDSEAGSTRELCACHRSQ